MQLFAILLVPTAGAAVAKPLLAKPDDALVSELDNFLLSKDPDELWSCDYKRRYDSTCQCEMGNFFKFIWCHMLPTCKSCGIPCKSCPS